MKILAADDEALALEMLKEAILAANPQCEVKTFDDPQKLLDCAKSEKFDVAFLDIRMRGMSGLELTKRLKDVSPYTNIVFVTGYDSYTMDAMNLHASGYILKPVTEEKVRRELSDLRYPPLIKADAILRIKCFGNFEVYTPKGDIVHFDRSKAKELLAYLVYRNGSSCSIKELAATIFEDDPYDRKQQSYIQKIVSSLMQTLRSIHCEKLIHKKYNSIAIDRTLIDCDYYSFMDMDIHAINAYAGEFMNQYSWAEFVVGYLDEIHYNKIEKPESLEKEENKED